MGCKPERYAALCLIVVAVDFFALVGVVDAVPLTPVAFR